MTAGMEIAGIVVAASVPATAAIGILLRPVRAGLKDLRPLTAKNSDGDSVFDEMRVQQKADSAALAQLAAEFPKNGVPARGAVDAISSGLVLMQQLVSETRAELAEVRTAQSAHISLHLAADPQTPTQKRRASRAKVTTP